jgi:type I restriction-modification system DNA methylase subunit
MLDTGTFDYIVGNPPYVPIEGLDEREKNPAIRPDLALLSVDSTCIFCFSNGPSSYSNRVGRCRS